jgi:hypothetical protein
LSSNGTDKLLAQRWHAAYGYASSAQADVPSTYGRSRGARSSFPCRQGPNVERVLAHSEKQDATATWKKTFGHHPLVAFVDHGQAGSGEPVAALLRPGNAGSNTASDHITTTSLALAQLPKPMRHGRQTLIRTDFAADTKGHITQEPSPHQRTDPDS